MVITPGNKRTKLGSQQFLEFFGIVFLSVKHFAKKQNLKKGRGGNALELSLTASSSKGYIRTASGNYGSERTV